MSFFTIRGYRMFWQPADAETKLRRAKEKLDVFDKEVLAFLKDHPNRLLTHLQPKGQGRYEVLALVKFDVPPPERLQLLAGEVLHQARSALDHLVFAMSLVNSSWKDVDVEDARTEFPIFMDASAFHKVHAKGKNKGKPVVGSGIYKVRLVEPAAQAIIKGLQPYQAGNPLHLLWILSQLENIDKHRRLSLVGGPIGRVQLLPGNFRQISGKVLITRPLKDPAPVMRWEIEALAGFEGKVTVMQEVPPHVAFDESIPLPEKYAGEILQDILSYIELEVFTPLTRLLVKRG